jgi:asparagine synthase (glutamine-hydrolysing)
LIAGCFSPAGLAAGFIDGFFPSLSGAKHISALTVGTGRFTGMYLLNSRLPETGAERWHSDDTDGICVLAAGTVYSADSPYADLELPLPELAKLLFYKHGVSFADKLNGDFLIFIADSRKGEAWLYNDHVGIEPGYWSWSQNTFLFHSDANELCRITGDKTTGINEYLLRFFKYTDLSLTFSTNVKRISPGHYLHITPGGVTSHKYWHPGRVKTNKGIDAERAVDDIRNLVTDAVRIRCDKRYTAAAHLSSGIDSAVTATLARREYLAQETFSGYSWSPHSFDSAGLKYDERDLAAKAAAKGGIMPKFAVGEKDQLLTFLNGSNANPWYFAEHLTQRRAAGDGVNLLFSGWGGDEFVSSGDAGIDTDLLRNLSLKRYFRRNPLFPLRRFAGYLLTYVARPALGILQPGDRKGFVTDALYVKRMFRKSNGNVMRAHYSYRSRREFHMNMLGAGHLQERCGYWSVTGLKNGLMYRYPLLDKRIIEYVLSLPSESICNAGNYRPLLREAFIDIVVNDVIGNNYKNDPVYWSHYKSISRAAAADLIGEIEIWAVNPSLGFLDFTKLKSDAEVFANNKLKETEEPFVKAVISIKAGDTIARIYSMIQ